MAFIDFTNGEVLTADQMDTVMRQSVMRFADATARDTALSAVLAEGMMCYLDDTNEVLKYDGSSWIDISGDITGVTAGTALTGGGTSGNVTLDVDTSVVQPNVITTQGDLVIGDGSGEASRIAIGSADTVLTSNGTTATWAAAGGGGGFNASVEITASDATYTLPSLGSDIVRLTIIGGGGGAYFQNTGSAGTAGGNTSVTYGGTTVTATGGYGGANTVDTSVAYSQMSANNGRDFNSGTGNYRGSAGGEIKTVYADFAGLSTINVTIGAGGNTGSGTNSGFRGVVILEYVSV